MTILDRLAAALEAAVETVIGAVVDRIVSAWVEEEASALCENPTKGRES